MSSAEAVFPSIDGAERAPLQLVPPAEAAREPVISPLTESQLELVEDHLYLVKGAATWVARRRTGPLDIEEAYSDGYVGLCDAASRFKPYYQVQFPTYAPPRVRGAIIDGERSRHKLVGPKRQEATVVSLFNSTPTVSMDEPLGPHGGLTLHDVLPNDDKPADTQALDNMASMNFYESLQLTERQRAVAFMKARKFTLRAIGDQLGVSERTVSREFKAVVRALFAAYHLPLSFD